MVFFCIPEAESNIKILSKKKLKHDIKESSQQKKCETGNEIDSGTILNNLNTVLSEMNTENFLDINIVSNVTKDIESKSNFMLPDVTISNLVTETESNAVSLTGTNDVLNNVPKEMEIDNNFILPIHTNHFTKIKTESNATPSSITNNDVNKISNEIKTENSIVPSTITNNIDNTLSNEVKSENYIASQSNIGVISEKNILNEQYHSVKEIKIESTHQPSVISSIHQTSSNELTKNKIKIELIGDSGSYNSNNENECDQNISTKSMTDCDFSLTLIPDTDKTLLDESSSVEKSDYCFSTTAASIPSKANESFNENIIKSEAIESLSECYIDARKQQSNESDKQLTNKWTIDEDKIILQTCKRVEDIEVLLETINRRIPQRSVSEVKDFFHNHIIINKIISNNLQIQERFTTLMTLLEQMIDIKEN